VSFPTSEVTIEMMGGIIESIGGMKPPIVVVASFVVVRESLVVVC
jgi:hypothetical protein